MLLRLYFLIEISRTCEKIRSHIKRTYIYQLTNQMTNLLIKILITLGSSAFLLAYSSNSTVATPIAQKESLSQLKPEQNLDFGRHFQELGIEGSILIYDLNSDRTYQHNPQRNLTDFPAASTFKILNSLIALETKVIADETALLTWDGIVRDMPEWNQDLTMKAAFKLSAVWFYQVLARRIGDDRMQAWITKVGYGNQKIGEKANLDRFWLNGVLKISPQAQVQFLRQLYQDQLPFSRRSISIVKDILIVERSPEYILRAKTGWYGFGEMSAPQIGWYVGYLERGKEVYFFATNIEIRRRSDGAARIELTRRCLKDLNLL